MNTKPNNYVDKPYYNYISAWKNRFKHRDGLERSGVKMAEIPNQKHLPNLAFYPTHNDYDIIYGNDNVVEEYCKKIAMEIQKNRGRLEDFVYEDDNEYPLYDNCTKYTALLIGHTGAPVKIRIETVLNNFLCTVTEKMYCNMRILAFNYKKQVWDVST